jgi:LuxR family maltose regulon positive regulatory protein
MAGEPVEHSRAAGANDAVIERMDLLETLGRVSPGRAIFIEAPAGFGKTLLISQWLSRTDPQRRRTFELKLKPWQQDADEVIRHLDEMLRALSPSAAEKPIVVIDDYHELSTPALDRWLAKVMSRITDVVFLISSRQPIRIGLGSDRLHGTATRLTHRDLRFSVAEVQGMLAGMAAPQIAADLIALTEGWPIAVDMFRMRVAAQPEFPPSSIGEVYVQPHGVFAEFVEGEVLSALGEDEQEILIRTSFLDTFNSDVARAVSEREDCWRMLEGLLRRGLLDQSEDETYHCHPLLRLILERKLRRRGSVHLSRLRKLAAESLRAQGALKRALQCAAPAGDILFCTRLFLDAGGILIGLGEGLHALQSLLDELPQQCLLDPRVRAAEACALMKSGRVDAAVELLRKTDGRDSDDPLVARDLRIADLLTRCSRSTATWIEDDDAVIDSKGTPDAIVTSGVFHNWRCIATLNSLRLPEALAHAEAALHLYQQAGARNGTAHILVHKARIARIQGELSNALAFLRQARDGFLIRDVPDESGAAVADAYIAAIEADLGNFTVAEKIAANAIGHLQSGEYYWEALYAAHRAMALTAGSRGDHSSAMLGLEKAIAHARQHRITQLEGLLRPFSLRQALRSNRPLRRMPDGPDGLIVSPDVHWMEADLVLCCRAWLLREQGRTQEARQLLSAALEKRTDEGLLPAAVEFALDLTLIDIRDGHQSDAAMTLRTGLQLAARCAIRGPFLEHRSELRPIVMLVQTSTEQAWRGSAGAELARSLLGGELIDATSNSLFSKSEQEVLNGIAAGRANKEIARELNISPDTVRFHLKNIYGKFNLSSGHANRRIVAMLAREQGLSGSMPSEN